MEYSFIIQNKDDLKRINTLLESVFDETVGNLDQLPCDLNTDDFNGVGELHITITYNHEV